MDTTTCIVALKHGDKVYLGGDSAATNESLKISIRKDPKVFVKDDADENTWLFGFTSSYRMGQLIQHVLVLPIIDRKKDEKDLLGYMVRKFIPALQKCLREGGYETKKEERTTGGTFIVAVKGEVFKIQSDYQVSVHAENFCATGCGEDLALGALYATKDWQDPEKRLTIALEAAETFSAGVQRPFIIISA